MTMHTIPSYCVPCKRHAGAVPIYACTVQCKYDVMRLLRAHKRFVEHSHKRFVERSHTRFLERLTIDRKTALC